ncbi:MAG: (Fe-S)-binding protein [Eggerthellaceae bacterium]|nr:(Fe-S)-binding protein [Eggerthellaceae bacterium]
MGFLERSDAYWKFAGQCTQCGHCTKACESLIAADMTLGDIAKALIDHDREAESVDDLRMRIAMDGALTQAVRGCFFCTSCKNTCFAHNDVCDLIYNARVDFQNLGLIPRETWSSVLVDEEWDIFTAYRAIHGIGYSDLTRHVATDDHEAETGFDVVFFPGCALAAYGPELTREIFEAFGELGVRATMLDSCCGSSLRSAGFFERAEVLCDRNVEEIVQSGAKQLVCVCPGCANDMSRAFKREGVEVEIVSLAKFLSDHGFEPRKPLPDGPICISKSCQDRDGSYLKETCDLLGVDPATPKIFHGCCGAGGAVSAFQPDRQAQQADSKLSFAPDGATVVTMCPTCTYTYAYRMMSAPRDISNKHYTELLFNSQFDWNMVFYQLGSMWSGEYGAWLAEVFA